MKTWDLHPAEDHGLTAWERSISARREPGVFATTMLAVAVTFGRQYLWLWHRYRVIGAEHLPTTTPFVLVANHGSHLDSLCLRSAMPLRMRLRTSPLAAGDVFFSSTLRAAFASRFINAIPMWRKRVGPQAMNALRERLIKGDRGYVLFPEGTRTRDGQMNAFKAGIGMLTAGLDVPIVPAWIDGAHAALPPGHFLPRPRWITVRFGPAIRGGDVSNDRAGWDAVRERVEAGVLQLQPPR